MAGVGGPVRLRLGALALGLIAIVAGGMARLPHATGQTPLPTPTPVPSGISGPSFGLSYPAGWNLIGVPPGATLPSTPRPIYTYQNAVTGYQTAAPGALQPGYGYWIYLNMLTPVTYPIGGPTTISRTLPAGQWVMVGNPSATLMLASGEDVMDVYNPSQGYQQTTVLEPGQGAWVFSYSGGTFTLTNVAP